jgi:hypothetical protein
MVHGATPAPSNYGFSLRREISNYLYYSNNTNNNPLIDSDSVRNGVHA